jgi:hypothetical protein
VAYFDIDNALYSSNLGILQAKDAKVQDEVGHQPRNPVYVNTIIAYIASLGFFHEKASKLRVQYQKQCGVIVRGVPYHHGIGKADFSLSPFVLLEAVDLVSYKSRRL